MIDVAGAARAGQTSLHFIVDFEFLVLSEAGYPSRYKFLTADSERFLKSRIGFVRNVVGNADPPRWDINNRVRGKKAGGGRARRNICTTHEPRIEGVARIRKNLCFESRYIIGFSNKLCENLDMFRVRSSREDRNSSSIALHFLFSFFQSQFSYPIRGTSSRLLEHVYIIPLTFIEAQPTSTTIPDNCSAPCFLTCSNVPKDKTQSPIYRSLPNSFRY